LLGYVYISFPKKKKRVHLAYILFCREYKLLVTILCRKILINLDFLILTQNKGNGFEH